MNRNAHIQLMLEQARNGRLGTPERPDRSNSLHERFWEGYFGHRLPIEFGNAQTPRACCRAGQLYRRNTMSDYNKTYEQKKRDQGYVRFCTWINPDDKPRLMKYVKRLEKARERSA